MLVNIAFSPIQIGLTEGFRNLGGMNVYSAHR